MIERLILKLFGKDSERKSWHMLLVGLIYATLSVLIVKWFFSEDNVLSGASGMMVIVFCVMFSMPYMYKILKREEKEDEQVEGLYPVLKEHSDVIKSFLWLFLGFVIALSFWNIALQDVNILNFQIETYCNMNSETTREAANCIKKYSPNEELPNTTGKATSSGDWFLKIFINNVQVMMFSIVFSLIFGAGAIFVLAWNASVIAAAIGVFTKYKVSDIPLGLVRYMIHGIPEIAAYFIAALAGGLIGIGVLKHGIKSKKFIRVLENSILLIFASVIILVIAAFVEVYITPLLI